MLVRVCVLALLAIVTYVCPVRAGTTGSLLGTIVDAKSGAPLAGVALSAVSPAQAATARSDANGRFALLGLSPDTYVVSVERAGYQTSVRAGVTIAADQSATLDVRLVANLATIGRTQTQAAPDLVRPGVTADVTTIDAETQAKLSGLGGGGTQDAAWSALASVPGVFVQPGLGGYVYDFGFSIRGGDADSVGYELDGVPVNRSFDNYPSNTLPAIGQQQLQVYTGAPPTSSEGQGLSGYINQVIKTGTSPGFQTLDVGLGGPTQYNKLNFELGGATPNRSFSYYVGLSSIDRNYQYYNPNSGPGQTYGVPIRPCFGSLSDPAPSCTVNGVPVANGSTYGFALGPTNLGQLADTKERDAVVNLHFAIPRKRGRPDDVQVLYQTSWLKSDFYSSSLDQGGTAITYTAPYYVDSLVYNGPTGGFLNPTTGASLITNYAFPQSPTNRATFAAINPYARDNSNNDQSIFKLQYTHAFSDTSLLKVYGYSYYSDLLENAPQAAWADYYWYPQDACCGADQLGFDYTLASHTRGASATWTTQLGAHTLALQGSYTTATTLRDNNFSMYEGIPSAPAFYLVNSLSPTSGLCYSTTGSTATPISCASSAASQSLYNLQQGLIANPSAQTCGTGPTAGPCAYLVGENGQDGNLNTVTPKFTAFSLSDTWKPDARLTLDYGLRLDRYEFDGGDTTGTVARTFFFNAWNLDHCVSTANGAVLATATPGVCPSGSTLANLQNVSNQVFTYSVLQPRVAGAYTLADGTVLRASYGRYTEPPVSAYEQYNTYQQNLPAQLGPNFEAFGLNTPGHPVRPQVSDNIDASLEHRFKGTDLSVKLTPFVRTTHDQIQSFYLNELTEFVSGFNVGKQTSRGFEFELDKGDFNRDGLSGKLAFTYTNSFIKYSTLANGTTVMTAINTDIATYNAYTSYCASHQSDTRCGTITENGGAVAAAPYYNSTTGAPSQTGGAGFTANPYWNAPVQNLLDPNGTYVPYELFPQGPETFAQSYEAPYVFTGALNWKRQRLALTPTVQFIGGQRYGAPETERGLDPASTSGGLINAIPDSLTGTFDTLGAFVQPSNLLVHLQSRYALSPRATLTANIDNIVNSCFGGTKWAGAYAGNACGYSVVAGSVGVPSNLPVPAGQTTQTIMRYPYEPYFRNFPLTIFVGLKLGL
jgi:hypothetical protein